MNAHEGLGILKLSLTSGAFARLCSATAPLHNRRNSLEVAARM